MRRCAVEQLIERPVLAQHRVDDVGRNPSRRQARRLRRGVARWLWWHAAVFGTNSTLTAMRSTLTRHAAGASSRRMDEKRAVPPAKKTLSPAAERALAEAAARRTERERATAPPAKEIAGRGGLDPARYGDWEVKGVASDF